MVEWNRSWQFRIGSWHGFGNVLVKVHGNGMECPRDEDGMVVCKYYIRNLRKDNVLGIMDLMVGGTIIDYGDEPFHRTRH